MIKQQQTREWLAVQLRLRSRNLSPRQLLIAEAEAMTNGAAMVRYTSGNAALIKSIELAERISEALRRARLMELRFIKCP